MTRSTDSLYDADFYAWTQEQARLLRAGRFDQIDIVNVTEEIEGLGRKEAAELRSRYKVLALHLLKEIFQPKRRSRSWETTILHQRLEIAGHLEDNPSLKSKADALFVRAYKDARKLAASETGLALSVFPAESPFTRKLAESGSPAPDDSSDGL